ncbi:flagellar biosynthesis anti-sigma factor FlgM [bacterium]|nr:flagellar biosynthesis anti-sigma factor FlgM [bacterium]
MKIRKRAEAVRGENAARQRIEQQRRELQHGSGSESGRAGGPLGSRAAAVELSLGKVLHDQLAVDQVKSERRARVEELKALYEEGKYAPSSEAVAESFLKEIFFEGLEEQFNRPP